MPLNLWHPHHNMIISMSTIEYILIGFLVGTVIYYLPRYIKAKKEVKKLQKELDELKRK
ncbi:LapA family protein [Lactobacillus salivarius]|nr:LapA family protein [Ligilactobacillus salivarius]